MIRHFLSILWALLSMSLMTIAIPANAALVRIDFAGEVMSIDRDIDFEALVALGDVVSGSVQFEFNPPPGTPSAPVTGGYNVPKGSVSGFGPGISFGGSTFAALDFRGSSSDVTGPSTIVGSDRLELIGVFFVVAIDSGSAGLDDYLALTTSDFTNIQLVGERVFSEGDIISSAGAVATLLVTEARFSLVTSVPLPGTLAMTGLALTLVAGWGRRRG